MTLTCLHPCNGREKINVKRLDERQEHLHLPDKSIESFHKINNIFSLVNLRSLTLSHNKIKVLPSEIDCLYNLENLNVFNNFITEIPESICNLNKLKVLNLGMNNIHTLPNGFDRLNQLEVLDLSYNFLNEHSFPPEFFALENLKALYLSDNDIEILSPNVAELKNLIIFAIRDNHLINLPDELCLLERLRELLIQNNRIRMIPPDLAGTDLNSPRGIIRMEGNILETDLADQLRLGISHVFEYIKTDIYRA
ncbi:uroporphyrinogen decarboxylase [Sarcoptes scabiei]|nr:uroporphyrinogen decarboxylase [Sarcoptes scabiei]